MSTKRIPVAVRQNENIKRELWCDVYLEFLHSRRTFAEVTGEQSAIAAAGAAIAVSNYETFFGKSP